MFTAAYVVESVKELYPDAPTTLIIRELNALLRTLALSDNERSDEHVIDNLVAMQRSYDLPPDVVRVHSAWFLVGPTSFPHTLSATSLSALDEGVAAWRSIASNTPTAYYLSSSSTSWTIGIYPLLTFGSVNGYPRLVLRVSKSVTVGEDDDLPPWFSSPDSYVAGTAFRVAQILDAEGSSRLAVRERLWKAAYEAERMAIATRLSEKLPRIVPHRPWKNII